MPLNFDQMKKLYLGCTVHFPPVFPELGTISIDDRGVELPSGRAVATLSVSDAYATRTLLLAEVAAVFIPHDDQGNVAFDNGEWLFGRDIQDIDVAKANLTSARKKAKAQNNASGNGIVFVRETVPVLTELTQKMDANDDSFLFGGPAAESSSVMRCCP